MRRAATSNSASARSPAHATSCRRCARDYKTNRNQCSRQFSSEAAWSTRIVCEIPARAAFYHRATLAFRRKADSAKLRELFAMPAGLVREIRSTNPARTIVDPLDRENVPSAEAQKDQQRNRRALRRRARFHLVV